MIVYAIVPYTYVYGGHNRTHKQGKAFPGRALSVVSTWGNNWLEISPLTLDRDIDPDYPNFWVNRSDVSADAPIPQPEPEPVPEGEVSDEELAAAILVILKRLTKCCG